MTRFLCFTAHTRTLPFNFLFPQTNGAGNIGGGKYKGGGRRNNTGKEVKGNKK